MPNPRTISCADCGGPYETSRQNTKVCRICRLLRDLPYLHERRQKCIYCEEHYAPLARGTFPACGGCTPVRSAQHRDGTCAICRDTDRPLLHQDIAVCLRCSTDPAHRDVFLKALVAKQQQRQKEFLT